VLRAANLTTKSNKQLLDDQVLNMYTIFQYLNTSFDGKLGLQNDVISNVLGHPYGCSKLLLQQQSLATKMNK
jgi:hypothetical protein